MNARATLARAATAQDAPGGATPGPVAPGRTGQEQTGQIPASNVRPIDTRGTTASATNSRAAGARAMPAQRWAFIATAAILTLLCALQALSLWRAPAAWYPGAIDIQLAPGESVALGQRELAAPQADYSHLGLRRDAQGAWWVRNLSGGKQLLLQNATGEAHLGHVQLQAGQAFQIGGARFDVTAASAGALHFSRDGQHWSYDGATLYREGRAQPACPDAGWSTRALTLWNRAAPAMLTVDRSLSFGGNVYCGNRLGLPGVTPGAALLGRADGRLQLASGNPDGERAALLLLSPGQPEDLRRQERPLAGVTSLVAGRTSFKLTATGSHLRLLPGGRIALFSAADATLPPQVSWQWRQRDLWVDGGDAVVGLGGDANAVRHTGQGGLWILLALTVAALAMLALPANSLASGLATFGNRFGQFSRFGHSGHSGGSGAAARGAMPTAMAAMAAILLLCGGVAALLAQRGGHPPTALFSLLLAASALWLWLLLPGRLTLVTAAGVVLLAVGLLAQLELGLGGMESSWLRYYQKSADQLAIGTGLASLWRLWSAQRRGVTRQRSMEWLLAWFAAVALLGLAAEVLWGDETGVFDLQPVELAKLALSALSAHCLALRLNWRGEKAPLASHGARWLRLIAPVLLFVALLALALVQVDDYSPLILLLVWSTAMALAYALALRQRLLLALLAGLVLLVVGAIVYLRCAGTDDLIQWGFYADRFMVWLDPAQHPYTGQQLLLGARAISDGGWWGADHFLGLAGLGHPAGNVVHIPAVQDDFAPAFFMNRHGLVGALLLWGAQAALLVGMLQTAVAAYARAAAARDFRLAWLGRFRCFTICGGAAFVLGHLLLSWGTNLAIFPIMGQPMSFLSAGGSHLLFFLCPLLALCAITEFSFEENESCRSMSSTKS